MRRGRGGRALWGLGSVVFDFAITRSEPTADFFGIVLEGTVAAFVGDAPVLVDHVEAFWPGGVRAFGGVVHVIDAEGHGEFVALDEIVGDVDALLEIFGLRVADVVFQVGFHLPLIGGMGLADVDGEEVGVVLVVVIDLRDVADLATEGGSSEAAEDEHERFVAGALAEVEMVVAIQGHQAGVRGVIADL